MTYLIDTDILIYSRKGNPIVNGWLQKNKNILCLYQLLH